MLHATRIDKYLGLPGNSSHTFHDILNDYCLAYLTTSSADPRCAALAALESAIISWLLVNKPKGESYFVEESVSTRSCLIVAI